MFRHSGIVFLVVVCALSFVARGETAPASTSSTGAATDLTGVTGKDRLLNRLPPSVSDGLDFNLWGWLGGYRNDQDEYSKYYDAEVGLGVIKSFNQTLAISAQGNFIDGNGTARGELEQGYASVLLNQESGAYLTVGKFNANFGSEQRDFWSRTTGTTSLLFGAQPQDLVGGMISLPVARTGITLHPFLSEDFQGQFDFNQSPSGGLMTEYQPAHGLDFAVTGWVGPGMVLFGGHSIQSPYPKGGYGDEGSSVLIGNWQGPNLMAERGGTLYFVEAKATWQATPALNLAAELVQGTSGTQYGRWGWFGFMGQADYSLTDKWRLFGRFSFLDDDNWLITGGFQRVCEYSFGSAYEIINGVEVRGEYRHDESNVNGNSDTFSLHLALTY